MQEVPEQIDHVSIMLDTATEVTLHFFKQVVLWRIFFFLKQRRNMLIIKCCVPFPLVIDPAMSFIINYL